MLSLLVLIILLLTIICISWGYFCLGKLCYSSLKGGILYLFSGLSLIKRRMTHPGKFAQFIKRSFTIYLQILQLSSFHRIKNIKFLILLLLLSLITVIFVNSWHIPLLNKFCLSSLAETGLSVFLPLAILSSVYFIYLIYSLTGRIHMMYKQIFDHLTKPQYQRIMNNITFMFFFCHTHFWCYFTLSFLNKIVASTLLQEPFSSSAESLNNVYIALWFALLTLFGMILALVHLRRKTYDFENKNFTLKTNNRYLNLLKNRKILFSLQILSLFVVFIYLYIIIEHLFQTYTFFKQEAGKPFKMVGDVNNQISGKNHSNSDSGEHCDSQEAEDSQPRITYMEKGKWKQSDNINENGQSVSQISKDIPSRGPYRFAGKTSDGEFVGFNSGWSKRNPDIVATTLDSNNKIYLMWGKDNQLQSPGSTSNLPDPNDMYPFRTPPVIGEDLHADPNPGAAGDGLNTIHGTPTLNVSSTASHSEELDTIHSCSSATGPQSESVKEAPEMAHRLKKPKSFNNLLTKKPFSASLASPRGAIKTIKKAKSIIDFFSRKK